MNAYVILILFVMIISINSMVLDYFHCKAATCQDFYYGFRNYPRQKDYVNVCYDTVQSLENIPYKYGKCFDDITKKLNPSCIYALAATIKKCVHGLQGIPAEYAQYHCGYKLMQNCAKHIGLERFPYNSKYQQPDNDD